MVKVEKVPEQSSSKLDTTVDLPEVAEDATKKRLSFRDRLKSFSIDTPIATYQPGCCAQILETLCACGIGAIGLSILLLVKSINYILSPAGIILGAVYFNEENCPAGKLAIIIIIGGCLSLFSWVLETTTKKRKISGPSVEEDEEDAEAENTNAEADPNPDADESDETKVDKTVAKKKTKRSWVDILLCFTGMAQVTWLIFAAIVVYKLYKYVDYEDDTSEYFCNIVLYRFSFWMVTIYTIVYPFAILSSCSS